MEKQLSVKVVETRFIITDMHVEAEIEFKFGWQRMTRSINITDLFKGDKKKCQR